jgi:hypothetical protein
MACLVLGSSGIGLEGTLLGEALVAKEFGVDLKKAKCLK